MEVCDHEVRIVQVDVDGERTQEDAGQSADSKQQQEADGVKHRRVQRDIAPPHRGQPIEDLDAGRNRHQERQERENQGRQRAFAVREHVMSPHQKSDQGDGDARESDGAIAEHRLLREGRDDLGDNRHARQNHDVDGGVRVKPEEVLEQDRVAAKRRVEDADLPGTLDHQQHHRDSNNRSGQHLNQRGGINAPHEQRHVEPAHTRRAKLMHGGDEVDAGEDGREAERENGHRHQAYGAVGRCAVWRVKGPARVDGAEVDRRYRHRGARQIDIEAQQIQPGERHVLRSQHQR